jgi:hypothetical protein
MSLNAFDLFKVTARVSRLSAASFNTIFFQMFVIKNVHTIYRTWVSNYNMIGCKSRAVV